MLDDWARALQLTAQIDTDPNRLLADVIEDVAATRSDAPALLSDRATLSYRALAARSRQLSRWALGLGIAKGDVVCLMMRGQPDYLAIWVGITRIGGVVALINEQLADEALAHCLAIVGARGIIASAPFADAIDHAQRSSGTALPLWLHGAPGDSRSIDAIVQAYSDARLTATERRPVTLSDRALCIYTSGTTGLPKAANVSHRRILTWSLWFAGLMHVQPADRMYNCLPMHHSIGGVVAVGSMLVSGASVVLREKFSARQFWDDVVRWDCTLFQYIGELCRYLVNAPPSTAESQHRLRLCAGNGLRADVWTRFQDRFKIPRILEFYAASEGSFSLFNLEGKPGAIGRVPGVLQHRFPAEIIEIDLESEMPVRDLAGFCVRCAVNMPGEAIGRIGAGPDSVTGRFEGYSSVAESEKKILRNVFRPGDAWLRSGDLMRKDEKSFFYFVDRIGNTFRWKGENVSTAQVAETLCRCPGVVEAVVYGVSVPGADGRAGMAALVVDEAFDLASFAAAAAVLLPGFARPMFLRLRDYFKITATFKQQNHDLKREGFDTSVVTDPLFFQNAGGVYQPFLQDDFDRLQNGGRSRDQA